MRNKSISIIVLLVFVLNLLHGFEGDNSYKICLEQNSIVSKGENDVLKIFRRSFCNVLYGKKKESFNLSINFINQMIGTHGEDSLYTEFAYLLLARHYLSFGEQKNGLEILSYIQNSKENQSYEENPYLNVTLLQLKAYLYIKIKDFKKSSELLSKALKISREKKLDAEIQMNIINYLSKSLISLKKYQDAEHYIKIGLGLYKYTNQDMLSKEEFISMFINYANIFEVQENYLYAFQTLKTGKEILEKLNLFKSYSYTPGEINFFMMYAVDAYANKEYSEAIFGAKKAIELLNKANINFKFNIPAMYNLIGMCHMELNHLTEALLHYEKALSISKEVQIEEKEKFILRMKDNINQVNKLLKQQVTKFKK